MKFRATIQADGGVRGKQVAVLHVLQALQRIERTPERKASDHGATRRLTLRLGPESFILCHASGVQDESQTWAHFKVNTLFREFRIESKRGNCIDLEAPVTQLLHAFKGCAESE